jgi:hypothetical protein
MTSRNKKLANDFYDFCMNNPELRFWQALRAWSGQNFVLVSNTNNWETIPDDIKNTFYWEGKDK